MKYGEKQNPIQQDGVFMWFKFTASRLCSKGTELSPEIGAMVYTDNETANIKRKNPSHVMYKGFVVVPAGIEPAKQGFSVLLNLPDY